MGNRKGFSLVEAMVVMVIMLLVMSSVFMMILYYRDVSGTEQARVRQTQESRFLMSVFSSELKNAGAVMTMTSSGGFLDVPPYFNGIYPMNNTNFADGVVLASADPNAVSKLTVEDNPTDDLTLYVNNTFATPAWAAGDHGIVIGPAGIYVFEVESTGANTIVMTNTPVYYSGLLDTTTSTGSFTYVDPETVPGNDMDYPINAPVMRLSDFSIYLVNQRFDQEKGRDVRDLVRVSDCHGIADVLGNNDPVNGPVKGVIAENIWDLQLVYTTYPNFPDVSVKNDFYTSGSSGTTADLLEALRIKTLKEMTVNVVALTDDYPGKGSVTYSLPLLADRPAGTMPAGKFSYRTFSFQVEPRNFNIKI